MSLLAKCRVCGKALVLRCTEQQCQDAETMGLLPLVVCNRCHDLHSREKKIETWISELCFTLSRDRPSESKVSQIRDGLRMAFRKYAMVQAEFHGLEEMIIEDAMIEALTEQPEKWWITLMKYRELVASVARQKRTLHSKTGSPPAPAPSA